MSCFIVDEPIVAALSDWIADLCNSDWHGFDMAAPKSTKKALECCKVNGVYEESRIYDLLHNLNKAAYLGRYSHIEGVESEVESWEPYQPNPCHEKHFVSRTIPYWEQTMLKRLDCFLYQCAEDPVYGCPLYNALDDLRNALAGHIARKEPAYENAGWGE